MIQGRDPSGLDYIGLLKPEISPRSRSLDRVVGCGEVGIGAGGGTYRSQDGSIKTHDLEDAVKAAVASLAYDEKAALWGRMTRKVPRDPRGERSLLI